MDNKIEEKRKDSECNHNLKDENNSLEKVKKANMIYPKVTFYVCKHCHKIIKI